MKPVFTPLNPFSNNLLVFCHETFLKSFRLFLILQSYILVETIVQNS